MLCKVYISAFFFSVFRFYNSAMAAVQYLQFLASDCMQGRAVPRVTQVLQRMTRAALTIEFSF